MIAKPHAAPRDQPARTRQGKDARTGKLPPTMEAAKRQPAAVQGDS